MTALREKLSTLLREDTILRRVLRNTGYMFSSQTLTLVLALVQSVFAARLLGTAGFGTIGIITQFVSSVNRLFSFRMGEFIVRFLGKELNERNIDRAGAVVKAAGATEAVTSVVAYVALYLLAPLGAQYIAKDPSVTGLIRLFGLSILAQITTETANGVLQITNHFRTQAVINTLQGAFTAGMIFIAFLTHGDLLMVLWAYLIGKFITGLLPILMALVFLERHLKRGWWRSPLSLLPSFKEMLGFAVSTNLSGTVKMISTESESLWVGYFLDPAAVGLYKIAMAIVTPLMMPITPFISTTFPEITRSVVAKKWQQLKQLLRRVTAISSAWTVGVLLVMLLFGREVIRLIYGAQYVGAYPALMILILGFGVANIFFWNRTLLLSFGRANIPLYVLIAAMLLKIGLAFVVVPALGIIGEALLLAVNQGLSVGILVVIGLLMIRTAERSEPESVSA
jgi:O-antigen/teichoic acid export membrane protein